VDILDKTYDVVDSTGALVEKAEPAPVVPKLTRGQLGKARKQFITVTNPRVIGCNTVWT
jgi:hypothetical protein